MRFILGLLALASAAGADTLLVPQQYPTIQAALNAASNGDEVVLADGVYSGPGNVDLVMPPTTLTLRSANGPADCIIDPLLNDAIVAPPLLVIDGFHGLETRIEGITFQGNEIRLDDEGGGAIRILSASPTVSGCIFDGNVTVRYNEFDNAYGGAIWLVDSNASFDGCAFVDNLTYAEYAIGGAVLVDEGSQAQFTACSFFGNRASSPGHAWGGAVALRNADAVIVDCTFEQNTVSWAGQVNFDDARGGAVYVSAQSSLLIADTRFIDNNKDDQRGGYGMALYSSGATTAVNCLFAGTTVTNNQSSVLALSGADELINCTVVDSEHLSGTARLISGGGALTNCILADNDGLPITGSVTITWSAVEGGYPGVGNINADPLLLSDHTLQSGSPAIDAGSTPALPPDTLDRDNDGDVTEPWPIDLAGAPRRFDDVQTVDTGIGPAPVVDMGAFEYRTPALIAGPILADTTWTVADSPYIVTDLTIVGAGAMLTIEPGVVVRFDPGASLELGSAAFGAGGLDAAGTPAQPIVFTSNLEDPQPGSWGPIRFDPLAIESVVDDEGAWLDGSRLRHCHITFGGGDDQGSVIIESRTLHIEACTVVDSLGSGVSATCTDGGRIILRDSIFERCTTSGDGGGVLINDGTNHIVHDCTFIANEAVHGGGMWLFSVGGSIQRLQFQSNTALGDGGGLFLSGYQEVVDEIDAISNTANRGGGMCGAASLGVPTYANLYLNGNTAVDGGGYCSTGRQVVADSIILGNEALDKGGGVHTVRYADFVDCQIVMNVADEGGGVYADGFGADVSKVEFINVTITNNTAANRGGGARLVGYVDVVDSTINSNFALRGGGAYVGSGFQDDRIHLFGVAIDFNFSIAGGGGLRTASAEHILLDDCQITGNIAGSVGAGLMLGISPDVTLATTTISNNVADDDGGGFWSDSPGTIFEHDGGASFNTIRDNEAARGAAVFYSVDDEPLNATFVCWGVSDINSIESDIWDQNDDPALAPVNVTPFIPCGPCIADCDDNDMLNILDFVCFQLRWLDGDPATDCNGDGVLNILDFVCFQLAFEAGCPK